MADFLQVVVLRRSGDPFTGARAGIQLNSETQPPSFQKVNDAGAVVLPLATFTGSQVTLKVTVAPPATSHATSWPENDTAHWPVELVLDFDSTTHTLTAGGGKTLPNEVAPLGKLQTTSPTFVATVFLSRVRDITPRAKEVLALSGSDPAAPYHATPFPAGQRTSSFSFADQGPLLQGNAIRRTNTADDANLDAVKLLDVSPPRNPDLSEAQDFVPKLVGTFIPRETALVPDPQLLYYIRPVADQDFGSGRQDHAKSFLSRKSNYKEAAYHFDFFWQRTLLYVQADPWQPDFQFAAGVAHQVTASGKRVGVVAPLSEEFVPNLSFGAALEAAVAQELMLECLAHARRAAMSFTKTPPLARVAASGFSNGNLPLARFLDNVRLSTSDLKNVLKEVYGLDPPHSGADTTLLDAAQRFLSGVTAGDPKLRFYDKFGAAPALATHPAFKGVHASTNPAVPTKEIKQDQDAAHWTAAYRDAQGFEDTGSADEGSGTTARKQDRTFAFLPPKVWPVPPPEPHALAIHSWIPATMVCHGLSTSGFK